MNVYIFHREDMWYPLLLPNDKAARTNAELNEGTTKVTDMKGKTIWKPKNYLITKTNRKMGLKTTSSGSAQWARISEGRIYLSTDREKETPYTDLEGTIIDLSYRDEEWKGEKIRKLNVRVNDGTSDTILSIKANSSYASSLVGFLKTVDLSRPLTLSPSYKIDKEGKASYKVFVSQDGKAAKSAYTRANPNGLPDWESVKVGNKIVTDNSAFLEFLEGVVINDLKPQLVKVESKVVDKTEDIDLGRAAPQTGLKAKAKQPAIANSDDEDFGSDLPF